LGKNPEMKFDPLLKSQMLYQLSYGCEVKLRNLISLSKAKSCHLQAFNLQCVTGFLIAIFSLNKIYFYPENMLEHSSVYFTEGETEGVLF
jgi:hypothetical protein